MSVHANAPLLRSRDRLAGCIAAVFGLAVPTATAASSIWNVTSCTDDGSATTLRGVIASPSTVSGDTVDVSACANSTISLAAGYAGIAIPQESLKIKGLLGATVTIDGSALDPTTYSTLYHTGTGTLSLYYLTVSGGLVDRQGSALGGCVYSRGSVTIGHTTITSCNALSNGPALGGGIYALGNVVVGFSTVSGNTASGDGDTAGGGVFAKGTSLLYFGTLIGNSASAASGEAHGGGAAAGTVTAFYATVSGNHVSAPGVASGGGFAAGSAALRATTISGNTSNGVGGGGFATAPFSMYNSTISGNSAATGGGALYLTANSFIYNSTIAFNQSSAGAPGVLLHPSSLVNVVLQSTLMSNNSVGTSDNDLAAVNAALITFNSGPANNLIRVTSVFGLPADTKTLDCPLLGPLRDNGGLTRTHQLFSKSVAIDTGNDVAVDSLTHAPYANDQRGPLPVNQTRNYVRVSGTQADIGAYEVQQDDVVFDAGFDGCNP